MDRARLRERVIMHRRRDRGEHNYKFHSVIGVAHRLVVVDYIIIIISSVHPCNLPVSNVSFKYDSYLTV